MKLVSILALLCIAASSAPVFGDDLKLPAPPKSPGKIVHYSEDTTLVRNKKKALAREFVIYEPAGYDDAENANRRYPVLYLLHGSPGNPSNFFNFGRWHELVERAARDGVCQQAIFVIPDGNYLDDKHGDSEWINSADGRDRFEDYVTKQMVAWTDANLRTEADPQHRVLCGVSEGAFGAVNIGLHHPEVFGKVVAISGYYHNDGDGWARLIMGSDPAFLRSNSPLDYLSGLTDDSKTVAAWKNSLFYLAAGKEEERYVDETRALSYRLLKLGVPQKLDVLEGHHGWALWTPLFEDALKTVLPPQSPAAAPSAS